MARALLLRRGMRTFIRFGIVIGFLVGGVAVAQAQPLGVSRAARLAGKNEISTQLGFQGGLGGATPGGAKLFFDYARQLSPIVWLNVQVNPMFAVAAGRCVDRFGFTYDCGIVGGNGHAVDALVGVKLKFPQSRAPIVPYAHVSGGVVGIFNRPYNDNGAAVVARFGGGFRWFVTPHVGLGAEMAFTLGGAFYSESCAGCRDAHNEFYRAIDMGFGAEFVF
jgi:hypothetical protein